MIERYIVGSFLFLQTELSHQEQSMSEWRRERDRVLLDYRKQAEEKKEFQEKVERRVSWKGRRCFKCLSTWHSITILMSTAEAYINPAWLRRTL